MGGSKEKYDERWWQRTSGRPRSSILAPSTSAMACRARRKQNQYLRVKRTRDGETDSHSHWGGCADCRSGSSVMAVDVLDGRPQSSRSASSPTVRAESQILLLSAHSREIELTVQLLSPVARLQQTQVRPDLKQSPSHEGQRVCCSNHCLRIVLWSL